MTLAPIILFTHNHPCHTHQSVKAFQKNKLASESKLLIYFDSSKNIKSKKKK